MTTICSLVVVAVKKGWNMFHLDVNNAFLHRDLYEDVYVTPPPRLYVSGPSLIHKSEKSLYGL